MACKTCGNENIDNHFNCNSCNIKKGNFKWCVIIKVPRKLGGDDAEGNLYDEFIEAKDIDHIAVMKQTSKKFKVSPKNSNKLEKIFKKYPNTIMSFKQPVFSQGEIFPIGPNFEREMIANERNPGKWDIEYEVFKPSQYKKALLRAVEATKEYYEPYDNLKYVEDQAKRRGIFSCETSSSK